MEISMLDISTFSRLLLVVLLHFVWQAIAVCWLVALVRSVIHPRFYQLRYAVSVLGLLTMLACSLVTAGYYGMHDSALAELLPAEVMVGDVSAATGEAEALTWSGWLESSFATVFGWFDSYRSLWLGSWFVGLLILMVRLSWSLIYCFQIRRNHQPLPPHLNRLANEIKQRLNLTRDVVVASSQQVTQAVATGIIKPMVLIPASWLTQLPVSAVEAVLAHELSHIKRWDLWINLLQRITETLFFFHPLVWWLSKTISSEREICCDQLAVQATGQPVKYVETLAQIANSTQKQDLEIQFGTAFKGGKNMKLLRRAKMILEPRSVDVGSPFRALTFVACVGMLASFGSYAYCSLPGPAAAAMQEDESEDQNVELHEYLVQSDDEGEGVFRVKLSPKQEGQEMIIRLNQGSDNSEIARQLRKLADQLEANAHAPHAKKQYHKRIIRRKGNAPLKVFEVHEHKSDKAHKSHSAHGDHDAHEMKVEIHADHTVDEDGKTQLKIQAHPKMLHKLHKDSNHKVEWVQDFKFDTAKDLNVELKEDHNILVENEHKIIIANNIHKAHPNVKIHKGHEGELIHIEELQGDGSSDGKRVVLEIDGDSGLLRKLAPKGGTLVVDSVDLSKKGTFLIEGHGKAHGNVVFERKLHPGQTSEDDIDDTLRQLKKEIHQLRNEIDRLKSKRGSVQRQNVLLQTKEGDQRKVALEWLERANPKSDNRLVIDALVNGIEKQQVIELKTDGKGVRRYRIKSDSDGAVEKVQEFMFRTEDGEDKAKVNAVKDILLKRIHADEEVEDDKE